MPKLNARLGAILDCIPAGYDDIWDCCCDHGYLGMRILQANLCGTVHFVDQVASIMQALAEKLQRYGARDYDIVTASAATLELDSSKRHLLILAGISGNTVIDIMQGLYTLHPQQQIDYIVSPNYQIAEVRAYLASRHFALAHEALVFEKAQSYEVIFVTAEAGATSGKNVTLTGNMWKKDNAQHRQYLDKLVFHYTNQQRHHPDSIILEALEAYGKIRL